MLNGFEEICQKYACVRRLVLSRSKGPITWAGLAMLGGLARLAEIPVRLRNTPKTQVCDYMEKSQPC